VTSIAQLMVDDGYALVEAATMRQNLAPFGGLGDWDAFAASWNGMPRDTYMADGGRYRRRLHAVFGALAGDAEIRRGPHRPHYQARDYNALNGGVARMYAPVAEATTATESFKTVLGFSRALFDDLQPDASWDIEMHQFRIESRAGEPGQPTPEGLHRDGVDYVLVLLIERVNIASGVTTIHAADKRLLGSFTLATPLDAALVHDREVYHGVTAVQPLDPALPAHRDVLVLTFRAV
jgi:hypothetical protein